MESCEAIFGYALLHQTVGHSVLEALLFTDTRVVRTTAPSFETFQIQVTSYAPHKLPFEPADLSGALISVLGHCVSGVKGSILT